MRSRQSSLLPDPVRKMSDLPHLDDRITSSAFTTPSRKVSLSRSAQNSPRDLGHKFALVSASPKQFAMELTVDSPASNGDASPWIGGTGLGSNALGKSGRVIERLMAENDRLRREMRAEIAKREELQRTVQTQKPKLEQLQAENARLVNIKSLDDNIIARRDRKIEELKQELKIERQRSAAAEARAASAEKQREDDQDASRKELQTEREKARHATAHADILQTSHQQLSREYRQRIASTNKALRELNDDKDEDRKRLARLDIVSNQMRQETERMRKGHADLLAMWHKFEAAKKAEFSEIEDAARTMQSGVSERERRNTSLGEEMEELMGRMRWAIRVNNLQAGNDSPPPSPSDQRASLAK